MTIYSPEGGVPQVVGQDRIPLIPPGSDFSVSMGRSNTLQGTRRIIERRQAPDVENRFKLVTRVEVTITNHGSEPSAAVVREGVENFGKGDWMITESSHPWQKLGERGVEFKLPVPANSSAKLQYVVEIR